MMKMEGKIEIRTLKSLEAFAKRFAKTLAGGETIALTGDLGAGKTAFAQALGRALGVKERMTSPTFTIMHLHGVGGGGRKPVADRPSGKSAGDRGRTPVRYLAHIDAYRLTSAKAFREIGALDYLGRPDTVAVVEWAEKVRPILPRGTVWMKLAVRKDGKTRTIEFAEK